MAFGRAFNLATTTGSALSEEDTVKQFDDGLYMGHFWVTVDIDFPAPKLDEMMDRLTIEVGREDAV